MTVEKANQKNNPWLPASNDWMLPIPDIEMRTKFEQLLNEILLNVRNEYSMKSQFDHNELAYDVVNRVHAISSSNPSARIAYSNVNEVLTIFFTAAFGLQMAAAFAEIHISPDIDDPYFVQDFENQIAMYMPVSHESVPQ